MIRHYITKYKEGDRYYAESWLQLELFWKVWCFSCKKIDVTLRFQEALKEFSEFEPEIHVVSENGGEKMEKQIIIFLKNSETLLFQDVSNVDVTDEYVAFDYFGKSTNQEKSGAFYFDNIAGWSASANLLE